MATTFVRPLTATGTRRWVVPHVALATEDEIDSREHELKLAPREMTDPLDEQRSIDRDDLREVGDGVLRQPGRGRREQNVARGVRPSEIARHRNTHDRRDAAAIERLALYHDHWSPCATTSRCAPRPFAT